MRAPSLPPDEIARQADLDAYDVLDTPPEPSFDDIVHLAKSICQVPIALVSLVDRDRQWFKASVGVEARETDRNISFCGHALLTDRPLIVPDARSDLCFAHNPLVIGPPFIRFYAGFQLQSPGGHSLGTLCVIDKEPRALSPDQLDAMRRLAAQVVANLELRKRSRELENARARAEAMAQDRAEFLATMSHEIRTPMNGVLGLTELLCDAELDEESAKLAETIRECGMSLVNILNDILDLSKLEAGRFRLDETAFEVRGLLERVQAVFDGRAREKGLTLELVVAPDAGGRWVGDVGRIHQVLANLVSNAIKFTEEGAVKIEVSRAQLGVRFQVQDSGDGIPQEAIDRLFRPYEQMGSAATGLGGTGLGLSICRRLVELMQGRIGCESSVGQGSCFWFELPLRPPRERELASTTDLESSEEGPLDLEILVADDNQVNLRVAQGMLERLGCRATLVENGEAALTSLRQRVFDVVLLDLQMPKLGGLEAAARIRADEHLAGLPLVALTASALSEDRQRVMDAGMNGFLAKPLMSKELEKTLRRVSRRRS